MAKELVAFLPLRLLARGVISKAELKAVAAQATEAPAADEPAATEATIPADATRAQGQLPEGPGAVPAAQETPVPGRGQQAPEATPGGTRSASKLAAGEWLTGVDPALQVIVLPQRAREAAAVAGRLL